MKKIRNIAVAIPTIIFLLAIVMIFRISISLKKGEIPQIFGFTFMEVQTQSMEPNIHQYDFIVNKKQSEYSVEDAVSFYYDLNGDGTEESVTHRIISFNNDGTITLRGDAAKVETDVQTITSDKIIGKVVYQSSAIGKLFKTELLKNRNFLFLFLIGSLVIFMIYQSFNIYKLLKEGDKEQEAAKAENSEPVKEVEVKEDESKEDIEAQIAALQARLKQKENSDSSGEDKND